MIRLVVGLGNPGNKYATTRHNIGFLVVDQFLATTKGAHAKKIRQSDWQYRFDAELLDLGESQAGGKSFPQWWMKPQTYMNLSGSAVQPCMETFGLSPAEVLIVYDELDLDIGAIKLKMGGGDGGHNGVASLIEELGSRDFWRLRIGISKPQAASGISGADHVLAPMPEAELATALKKGCESLAAITALGTQKAMQQINRREQKHKIEVEEEVNGNG